MLELCELIKERQYIIRAFLENRKVDFSKLREICKIFNDRCVVKRVFECEGTDQQLWESVNTFFQNVLNLT